jgi:BirA family transcriptional regulator, biotin operon repressor / biotin---[acetyl-CoA-carboxylase] ligase
MVAGAGTGSAHDGDWLIADIQDAGRGRMGRAWVSPPGNLHASGLVRLKPDDPAAPTIALVAAVALHDSIMHVAPGLPLILKWPNDLMIGGAKLSGILLERSGDAVIVGIGVNLAHHPDTLDRPVTSVAAQGVVAPAPVAFMAVLADYFALWIERWRHQGLPVIRAAWLARAHPPGTALAAASGDRERIDGLFAGLTDDCALRLRLADGTIRVIHAGDVFMI